MSSQSVGASAEHKNFSQPDETRSFDKGKLEVINMAGHSLGRATFDPGWKWSECVKPIAQTGSCQVPHFGYVISGRMHVRMDDGTEVDVMPGDAVNFEPGHDAWVVGQEPCVMVDFLSAPTYAKRT